jgi:hypothetical protein
MTRSRRCLVALVAAVLLAAPGLPGSVPSASAASPFTDIASSIFKADIEWLWAEEITTGCTPTKYCPDSQVYRDEMASFLARMFDLPPTPNDYFSDDEGNIHQDSINRVAAAGITLGCNLPPTQYCPHDVVRRDHIAAFISRAVPLTIGDGRNYFRDENGSEFEVNIDRAAAAGIASGCGTWRYCPDGKYTRGQMAAFLHRVVAPLPAPPYPAPAAGITFYVATTGANDGNNCLTPGTPCRTVKYAIDQTIVGDTIQIGPGTYAEPPLVLPHGLDIIGDGGGGTRIDVASSAAPALTITGTGSVSIDHIDLHSAGGGTAIPFQYKGELSVTDSTFTGSCATCDGVSGAKFITNTTISGYGRGIVAGGTITNSTITANAVYGAYSVGIITNSTISGNGGIGVRGGGFTITNSTISGNGGDGISKYFDGISTISDSTISGNGGSGISKTQGTLTIVDSTVDGNGNSGVWIVHGEGQDMIANSTITGNTRPGSAGGGGVLNNGYFTKVVNSTITGNTAGGAGAGISSPLYALNIANTIVAGNTRLVTGAAAETAGLIVKLASIVGVPNALTLADILDPAGLADHGGPTETIALTDSPTNPALDTGDAATCAAAPVSGFDQRGLPRTPPCDLGAYEVQP